MTPLFNKLNLKHQRAIVVLNAPAMFEAELQALGDVEIIRAPEQVTSFEFALVFATQKRELDNLATRLIKNAKADAVLWFAYPKGSSKNYQCDFNRDNGWDVMTNAGYDGVRMVAIDDDWSALRFRQTEFIKRR